MVVSEAAELVLTCGAQPRVEYAQHTGVARLPASARPAPTPADACVVSHVVAQLQLQLRPVHAVHGWRFRAPTRASYESAAPITARRLLPRVLGWHEHLQQARRHGAATAVHSRVYTDDIHCELHIAQLVRQRAAHPAQIALTLNLLCRPCVLAPPNSCANPKKQRRTLERQPPLGAPLRRAGGRCTLALVEMPRAGL